jgi:hypothetical protein
MRVNRQADRKLRRFPNPLLPLAPKSIELYKKNQMGVVVNERKFHRQRRTHSRHAETHFSLHLEQMTIAI